MNFPFKNSIQWMLFNCAEVISLVFYLTSVRFFPRLFRLFVDAHVFGMIIMMMLLPLVMVVFLFNFNATAIIHHIYHISANYPAH